jgi:hypothetical protein
METPGFSVISCGGTPENDNELRNSVGNASEKNSLSVVVSSSLSKIESALLNEYVVWSCGLYQRLCLVDTILLVHAMVDYILSNVTMLVRSSDWLVVAVVLFLGNTNEQNLAVFFVVF